MLCQGDTFAQKRVYLTKFAQKRVYLASFFCKLLVLLKLISLSKEKFHNFHNFSTFKSQLKPTVRAIQYHYRVLSNLQVL